MLSKILSFVIIYILVICCAKLHEGPDLVVSTEDVNNFWEAYDQITSTEDSLLQYHLLDSLYLSKGTKGLDAIRQARNYTPQDYIAAINKYPKFWESVRKNTLKANQYSQEITSGIEQLSQIYPDIKPAAVYFTIGALRTGGTTIDSLVLIGSEVAMADEHALVEEFPAEEREGRRAYFDSNPIDDLTLLNVHEYVHTQQNQQGDNILSIAIREGIAEFVSTLAMDVPSSTPAIQFGKENADIVRAKFEQEMFYTVNRDKWFWSDYPNEFGVRDLGYYVGYQMAENYYKQAEDKSTAIKTMIELDYTDEFAVEDYIKKADYFSTSLEGLYQSFESSRPYVAGIREFENNSQNVELYGIGW